MRRFTFITIYICCLLILNSCVDNNFLAPPIGKDDKLICFDEVNFSANHTINELKALFSGDIPMPINEDVIISGIVVSSDEAGNFYKELILQSDNGGIAINIDRSDLYNDFKIGQKIYIKCNGLWIGKSGNQIELGKRTYKLKNGKINLDRIPNVDIGQHIYRDSCPIAITPKSISYTDVSDGNLFKLVSFSNVQFNIYDVGGMFAIPEGTIGGPASVNRKLEDCDGNSLIVRTSGYATFAETTVPKGNGSITAVLTKYNSDYQLILNSIEDIKMNDKRCNEIIAPEKATHTIAQLKAMYSGNTFMQITNNVVIEGIVTANDKNGNFYKEIFIQDGTAGIRIKINKTGLNTIFGIGQKVLVNTKKLYLDNINDETRLGDTYVNNGTTKFGGIGESVLHQHIFNITGGNALIPEIVTIPELTNDLVASIVKIDSIQFINSDLGKTYAGSKGFRNLTIEDCDGNTLVVRTSSFADFADQQVAQRNGSIAGMLGIYKEKYQLYIRDINEVEMSSGTRCTNTSSTIFKEDFEAIVPNADITLTGWTNHAQIGTVVWKGKSYSNNKFAQFSAFKSGEASTIGWLIIRDINMDIQTSEILTFKTKDGYDNGAKLEILISTDYGGSGDPIKATWTQLSATISSGHSTGYAPSFTNSGDIDLSNITGTAHIAFRYTGGDPEKTTTFQIDEIVITGKR